MALNDAY